MFILRRAVSSMMQTPINLSQPVWSKFVFTGHGTWALIILRLVCGFVYVIYNNPVYVFLCTMIHPSVSLCVFVLLYYISLLSCQLVVEDDKSPLTIYSHAALHCMAGARFSWLSDTQADCLPSKLPQLPKWSSHFQGERPYGITHFVLGITFSQPVWLSAMDMAGWRLGRQMEAAGYPDTCWAAVDESVKRGVGGGGCSIYVMYLCEWESEVPLGWKSALQILLCMFYEPVKWMFLYTSRS